MTIKKLLLLHCVLIFLASSKISIAAEDSAAIHEEGKNFQAIIEDVKLAAKNYGKALANANMPPPNIIIAEAPTPPQNVVEKHNELKCLTTKAKCDGLLEASYGLAAFAWATQKPGPLDHFFGLDNVHQNFSIVSNRCL